jgi:hypothetical protein
MKGAVAFLAAIGTSPLLKWSARGQPLEVGDLVRVRTKLSPLAGRSGEVAEFAPGDPYGPYLVQFAGGLQFRYRRNELALTFISDSAKKHR